MRRWVHTVSGHNDVFSQSYLQSLAIAALPLQSAPLDSSDRSSNNWPMTSIVQQSTFTVKLRMDGGAYQSRVAVVCKGETAFATVMCQKYPNAGAWATSPTCPPQTPRGCKYSYTASNLISFGVLELN
jgi:hypothetical protein